MDASYEAAVERLRDIYRRETTRREVSPVFGAKDRVLRRYQPIFAPDRLPNLTEPQFHAFLLFRNNMHWQHLQRQSGKVCSDMPKLRHELAILQDDSLRMEDRVTGAEERVWGLGMATLTAFMQVVYPSRCGVWNRTSERAPKELDLWPRFVRGATFGEKYAAINDVLTRLASDVEVDLWALDALFWRV